ncbi:hypothetical protein GCK72_019368 [Caenorhabditis remanei]|uniref:Uncharacterized protein n=1 Tax=Caenorhabditis remanei TaxID=31234 RepID=A0A6A5GDQ8_CAERE|nr:hypothetical protein GCK72_019368 [Caenorhabditis remanei]KAF1752813.1 hypothetical protein GCK72_019368 [Caenorhabditis remanei]
MTSRLPFRITLILILLISNSPTAQRNRRKQKFVRLPSGFTFPADAASNFQRDSYIPATFAPPSEKILQAPPRYVTGDHEPSGGGSSSQNSDSHGINYAEYKKAMQENYPAPAAPVSEGTSHNYQASPPPVAATAPTIPPVTVVESPGMPPDQATTIAPGPATTAATMGLRKEK